MDFLKVQAQKIREQLSGLTPSQKMLAGSLVVIMVMTLLWWSKFAATAEMVELFPQDFTPEQITRVTGELRARGITTAVVGARIQVPAERQAEAMGLVSFEKLLPEDTSAGFDAVITKMDSPWNADKKQDVVFNRALEMHLAQIMRQWPGVRSAMLSINSVRRRAFGDANIAPSAIVNIQTKTPGEKQLVKRITESAADTVAGAVAGMDRSKVNIIIDGASFNVQPKDGSVITDSWMEHVREGERHFSQKIQSHLGYINGVMVSVSVDPKTTSSQFEKEFYDKEKTFDRPQEIKESTTEESTTTRGPSEPGVVPNVGGGANQPLSIAGANEPAVGGGDSTTKSQTDTVTKNQVLPSVTREWKRDPAGSQTVLGASVMVPRSHFVKIFKAANTSAGEPDDTALAVIRDSELRRLKGAVLGCIRQTPEKDVVVDWYYDYMPQFNDAVAAAQPAVASSIPLALTGHAKEIALGGLALFSLFMVSMMVKKGTPAPIIVPKPEKLPPPGPIGAEEYIAGEATEGNNSMDAMEIDDDAVRTQQMISQVQTMVKENPDAAANLVKRWLNRS